MKKLSLILLLSLTSLTVNAQWTGKYKAGLNGGHEWNIFLNPITVQNGEDILRRNDLWVNAYYAGAFVNADFKKNIKDGRLKWGTAISGASYNSTVNANRHSFRLYGSYRKKYAPRKYFEFAPEFYRIKRQGINDNDAILTTPFSYTRITLPFKFDFYKGNRVWLKTRAGYTFKAYDKLNNKTISYHAGFVGASLSKKWIGNQVERKLTFSSNLEMRLYKDLEQFIDEEEPDEPGEVEQESRLWAYFSNDLVYDIKPQNSPIDLSLGLYTTIRFDRDWENGYLEFAPGLDANWRLRNMTLKGRVRYVNRNYPDREVGENEEPLRYQFVRANLEAQVPVRDNLDFFVRGNMINRKSSNTGLGRGFRGYFNSLIETGIVLKF